jgi:hypothetical protein
MEMPMGSIKTQVPTRRIPLGLVGMVMWIEGNTKMACFYIPLTNVDDGNPNEVDMESECNGAMDIYDDALVLVIAYLQACEVWINTQRKGPCCA